MAADVRAARRVPATGAAHLDLVYKRTGFGPFPGQIEAARSRFADGDELVDHQMAQVLPFEPRAWWPDLRDGALAVVDGGPVDIDARDPNDLRYREAFRAWWIQRMLSDEAGLHEKMMWFWHGVFTTASSKVDRTNLVWRQLRTIHRHALGNFGDLAKALTVDGAMLRYLDGAGSVADSPNENYGRELMELFTLGIGHYTQDDVEAAARVLAGWTVDDDLQVHFDPARAITRPESLLGVPRVRTVPDLIDAILEQDACAPFVVGKLWDALVGGPRDEGQIARWSTSFRSSGYEIAPLVAAILHSDAFRRSSGSRPRTAIEWYAAAVRAAGAERARIWTTDLADLGQSPYIPPNVAGWPGPAAWSSSNQAHARARLLGQFPFPAAEGLVDRGDAVRATLERCSIVGTADQTRRALDELLVGLRGDTSVPSATKGATLMTAALLSPEAATS